MDSIFNFNHTYAGGFIINGDTHPCTLSFPDNNIIFTVIKSGKVPLLQDGIFSGYISTERGIMNFKALDAYQIAENLNWSNYSKEQFFVNSLIVSNEKNNINQESFAQVNISYDNLDLTGTFAMVDQDKEQPKPFQIKRPFEEIVFIKTTKEELTLENTVRWKHQRSERMIFSVTSDPFFYYTSKQALSIKDLGPTVKHLASFMQLLFGLQQSATDLILYDIPTESTSDEQSPALYYFFNNELISSYKSRTVRHIFNPSYKIEDLITEIPTCYQNWMQFSKEQERICWLYFNEINSKQYIRDDRFKNFCAIIQGLHVFGSSIKTEKFKGEMNGKFRNAIDDTLEHILTDIIALNFLHKLFELLGDQRDHYQHLSKKLAVDFNENPADMIMVNSLLQAIIRYHLLRAVAFDGEKIITMIQRDIRSFEPRLRYLQMEFTKAGRIQ